MTVEEFIEQIEQIRHERLMLFTSEIQLTDTYIRLHGNNQNITNTKEKNLIEKIKNIDEFIKLPNDKLYSEYKYQQPSSRKKTIENLKKNLTDIKKLIKDIF